MGLDMYLTRKTYVQNWDHYGEGESFAVTVTQGGEPFPFIKPERVTYIEEEVCYWRKANAIHGWFVREVQDGVDECQESYVPVEKLKELVSTIELVLANPELADVSLPTETGFFFGSTDYDDYYFAQLRRTAEELKPYIAEYEAAVARGKRGVGTFMYRASW